MIDFPPRPVPPGAVRIWRGFRPPDLEVSQFHTRLGTVLVPATALMQIDAGLHAYTPTIPAGLPGKPDGVPDETALLCWESQAAYWNGFARLAVRAHALTHHGVYATNPSRADFPVAFAGSLSADQPVYLFEKPADWMHGAVTHLVAARPLRMDVTSFAAGIIRALASIRETVALDGAIACVGNDYLVYWELGPVAPGMRQRPSGVPLLQAALQAAPAGWSQTFTAAPTFLPIGLWDAWSGMDVRAGSSFNLQFMRQCEQ